MQQTLFNYPNLDVRAGSVFDLVFDVEPSVANGSLEKGHSGYPRVTGVKLGISLLARTTSQTDAGTVQTPEMSFAVLKLSFARGHFSEERSTSVTYFRIFYCKSIF
jgi:hypothetical protein